MRTPSGSPYKGGEKENYYCIIKTNQPIPSLVGRVRESPIMANLVLGKRYRGAIRMTENNDGQLRQVITIYPEEGKGKSKVASFVTEHGKIEVSQQSLFVKLKLPLPVIESGTLDDIARDISEETEFLVACITEAKAAEKLQADRDTLDKSVTIATEEE